MTPEFNVVLACVVQHRVMLCGSITAYERTPLVIVDDNLTDVSHRDIVIQQHVIPCIDFNRYHPRLRILQEDNACCSCVTTLLQQNNVNALSCLAISPDLTSIEHIGL